MHDILLISYDLFGFVTLLLWYCWCHYNHLLKKYNGIGSVTNAICHKSKYIFISFTYLYLFREVNHHRKKLTGRKLDFDCKKRQGANDEDVRKAEEKFAESLHLAQLGNLIWRRKKNQFNLKKNFNFTNFFFFIRYAQSTRRQRSRTYFAINTIFRGKKHLFFNVF